MNYPHPTVPRPPGSLKNATVKLVTACGGTQASADHIEALGLRKGMSQSQMHRYGSINPADVDCYMPADIVAALEAHCKQAIVSRYLSLQAGYVLIAGNPGTGEAITSHLAAMSEKFGDVIKLTGWALVDGKVDPDEAAPVIAALQEELNTLSRFYSDLKAIQERPRD